jgi:transposase
MNTKRQHKSYTTEFRAEALALISEQGYSVQEASSALGITTSLLYSWRQKAENISNSTVNSDERAELLSLRKEVKTLRMEKEILKKARAFFAKEMK